MNKIYYLALSLIIILTQNTNIINYVSGENIYPEYIKESEQYIVIALNKINEVENLVEVNEYISMMNDAVQYLEESKKQYNKNNLSESNKLSNDCNEIIFNIIRGLDESINRPNPMNTGYEKYIRIIMSLISLIIVYYLWQRYRTFYLKRIMSFEVAVTE